MNVIIIINSEVDAMTNKEKIITSKYLNRIKIAFSDDLMDLKSYWCRYAMFECDKFNRSVHHHTFYELHYCLAGSAEFEIGDKSITLRANHFIFLPPSIDHKIVSQSKYFEKLIFGFEIKFNSSHEEYLFYKKAFENASASKLYADTETMRIIPNLMINYCYHRYENMYSGLICALRLIIHEISTLLMSNTIKQERVISIDELKKSCYWSDRIVKYIGDNISRKLTTNDISEQFHISSQQLNRILMAETHMTVAQIVAQKKFETICQMLEKSSFTLHEIATKTGFSNEYNLNRFFKTQSGMTPGKYRKSIVKSYIDN